MYLINKFFLSAPKNADIVNGHPQKSLGFLNNTCFLSDPKMRTNFSKWGKTLTK